MAINKVKGTYDVLPDESFKWIKLENMLRQICTLYNYKEIRTPIMEYSELFHRAVGEGSDMVNKETYDFKDRGDRGITLRPEGTAGVVRSFIENKLYASGQVEKMFYIGQMFRYERPQKGRYRQFMQFGIEAFGSDDPKMDAEVISLATMVIKAAGLTDIKVHLNSMGDEESRNNYREALVKYFTPHANELCIDCQNRLQKNPLRILDCKVDKNSEVFKNAPHIIDYLNEASLKHFNMVKTYLKEMNIETVQDHNLVRGFDYYTHTVFEVEANVEGFGAQNILCGGGRYNNLVESLGGPATSAVGFAFGMERLLIAIESAGKKIKSFQDAHLYLLALGEKANIKSLAIINELRNGGLICESDFQNRGMKGQFKIAERINARFIGILGDDELEANTINIKDTLNKTQDTISIKELYSYIIGKLNEGHSCHCHGEDKEHDCDCHNEDNNHECKCHGKGEE